MPDNELLGRRITAARQKAGYDTIYAASKASGFSTGQLHDLEAGKHSPSLSTLERLAAAFGCGLADLIGGPTAHSTAEPRGAPTSGW